MSLLQIWQEFVLPVVQFLVGPILTGLVVYLLTSRSNRKTENDKSLRQLNTLEAKMEKLKVLVNDFSFELNELDSHGKVLQEMAVGNFDSIADEYNYLGNEENYRELYKDLQRSSLKKVNTLKTEIKSKVNQLKTLPEDHLPPTVQGQLTKFIESEQVKLDSLDIEPILNSIKKYK